MVGWSLTARRVRRGNRPTAVAWGRRIRRRDRSRSITRWQAGRLPAGRQDLYFVDAGARTGERRGSGARQTALTALVAGRRQDSVRERPWRSRTGWNLHGRNEKRDLDCTGFRI